LNYNFYEAKRYKLFILIPIALLLISLAFIPHIQYDSSLAGGITVQFSTTNAITTRGLTSSMSAIIKGATASVSRVGAVYTASVTIPENTSIVSANDKLLSLYSAYGTYTSSEVNLISATTGLKSDPTNATLKAELVSAQANVTASLHNMSSYLSSELVLLSPFINTAPLLSYNKSDASGMLTIGKNAYSNASSAYKSKIISEMRSVVPFTSYSYEEVTPTLGAFFLNHMIQIIIAAFIIIAIAVFAVFRIPIPSLAVVFGAGNDILIALGAMGAFGIPMGLASVGGLLMLIGYSIDTEMLSSIRILKRSEDTVTHRAFATMKTGTTMTVAAIISFATLFAIAYIFYIPTYIEIAGVAMFGLIADIFTTWFGNTIMVVWYKLSREPK
jgi:preprotein translocase subunit SecF